MSAEKNNNKLISPNEILVVMDFDQTLINFHSNGAFNDNREICSKQEIIPFFSSLSGFLEKNKLKENFTIASFGYNKARISLVLKPFQFAEEPLIITCPILEPNHKPNEEILKYLEETREKDLSKWRTMGKNNGWGEDCVCDVYRELHKVGLKEFAEKLRDKLKNEKILAKNERKNIHIAILIKIKNAQNEKEGTKIKHVLFVDDDHNNQKATANFKNLAKILEDEDLLNVNIIPVEASYDSKKMQVYYFTSLVKEYENLMGVELNSNNSQQLSSSSGKNPQNSPAEIENFSEENFSAPIYTLRP
jgi:hypothetical protein